MKLKFVGTLLAIFSTFLLVGCGKDHSALEEFKRSTAAQEVNQCVGANGSVEWSIFQPVDNKNPDVRVIQAVLAKSDEKYQIQWFYNLSTKVSELAFAGKPGEKTSPLRMGLDLGVFCLAPSK